MVRPLLIILGAIPVILAILIAIPLVTKPDIPFSATNPDDRIEVEYIQHQLKRVSHGVTERTGAQKTEVLVIKDDGKITYRLIEEGRPSADVEGKLSEDKLKRIIALIKETGIMAIPSESFPVNDDVKEYEKSTIKVTLNGQTKQLHWAEQNATAKFVPPIITMLESELDGIIKTVRE